MKKPADLLSWADERRDLWLDCIRIYLGLGLFVRGLLLMTNTSAAHVTELVEASGQSWLIAAGLLHYVVMAHLVGGVILTVGFLTRLAALVQVPVLLGAVFLVHRHDGLFAGDQSLEFAALVLFMLVMLVFSGAGRFSVDHLVFNTDEERHPANARHHGSVS